MNDSLGAFERAVRASRAPRPRDATELPADQQHPFETRNIHPDLPSRVRKLFDDGYLSESVFAAFKFVELEVKRMGKTSGQAGESLVRGKTGENLMGAVFGGTPPLLALNAGLTDSDGDEQRGYQNLFKGAVAGIRNPRGHELYVPDTPDEALDYLGLASLLLRKLDVVGR